MSFKDKVAAGATLIKDALQSQGFVSGSTGWQVRRDGSAEFSGLVARGDVSVPIDGDQVSLTEYVKRQAYSGTIMGNDLTGITTNPSAIPGSIVEYGPDLFREIGKRLTKGGYDTNIRPIDWTISVTAMCHSTSDTGSGGHVQARYVSANGNYQPWQAQQRNGNNAGLFMMTQNWADSDYTDQVCGWGSGFIVGPTLRLRHTGSTPYIVDTLTWLITWTIR